MISIYQFYKYPYYVPVPMYYPDEMMYTDPTSFYPYQQNQLYNPNSFRARPELVDYGPEPFLIDIEKASKENKNYRRTLWTGKNLQVTLMSIDVGESIGLEVHPNNDQFIRIEEGQGLVQMGDQKARLDYEQSVYDEYAIMIPAGKWHNVTNTGRKPLKLYAIYAPPEHPRGTVHETKEIAEMAEEQY